MMRLFYSVDSLELPQLPLFTFCASTRPTIQACRPEVQAMILRLVEYRFA